MRNVVIVDDHPVFRNALRMMLELIPGLTVTAEHASHPDLRNRLPGDPPDLLFVDVHLRRINAFDFTRQVRAAFPGLTIVLMSMFAEEGYRIDGFEAGARAVLFKPSVGNTILPLLNELFPGEFPQNR